MKKILYLASIVVLCLAFPSSVWADDETVGTVEVGGWDAETEGSEDVVSEYESTEGGVDLNLDIATKQGWGHLALFADVVDSEDQAYAFKLDVGRVVRSVTEYSKMLHRLGHDPLANLAAVTSHGRVVLHTDLDPGAEYQISYRDLSHRTEFQSRGAAGFTLGVGYRLQERHGVQQSINISHCDACHVESQGRPIDSETQDATIDATYAWAGGQLEASFLHRSQNEGVPFITYLYDDALHPESRLPIFDNRVQYDSAQGPLPVDLRPEMTKDVGKLALTLQSGGIAWNVRSVFSTTENDTTGLASDYDGFLVNAARSFGAKSSLRWRARYYSISNDDVFVDTNEPLGIAGPQAGRTYREIYGFDPDFLRLSALNRDVTESRFDYSYRISKEKGTVKLTWNYESIDREHYEVAPGETETTENVFGISWWARPKKGLRLQAALRHGTVDNPFGTVDSAFSTLVSSPAPNPFHPDAAQYYQFQDARIADLTASPESWDEAKLGLSYTLGNRSLSATYRYWDGDNVDDNELTDWSKNQQAFNLTYFAAPAETWQWWVAYTLHQSELKFPTFIPIFDG